MRLLIYSFLPLLLLAACTDSEPPQAAAQLGTPAASPAAAPIGEVVALGRIEPETKLIGLASEVSGVVQRVHAHEGQMMQQGAIIVEISNAVELAQVAQATAKLSTQQAQITADQAALHSAELSSTNLQRTYQRIQDLVSQGAETQQSLDDARTQAETQQQEVRRLKGSVAAARQQLAALRSDVAVAQTQVQQRYVRAPVSGQLLKLVVVVGGSVSPGTSLGDFAPAGRITALCEVDELFANRIQVGQPAYIRTQGALDTLATGTVGYAAPYLKQKSLFSETAGDAEDRRVREVRIILPQGQGLLFNSRVECVITVGKKEASHSAAQAGQ